MRLLSVIFLLPMLYYSNSMAAATIEFVAVPAGSFMMGTADLEEARIEMPAEGSPPINDEQPLHKVELSAFEISKYEITQAQWLEVMGFKQGPDSHWQRKDWRQLPVVSVNWNDAQDFIKKLNSTDKHYRYRLPTEAEWEYVARAGDSDLRPFAAKDMDKFAWTILNSRDVPQPVGKLQANKFGVYDIYGNAWEWVNDWYQPEAYSTHAAKNPNGPDSGSKKIRRGGSYHCPLHFVRAGYRAADKPQVRYSVTGFRLVREKQ